MAAVMAHRGPDGEGTSVRGRTGFGHRRLSIIDLAHGAQPMESQDGRICVTYNGEIYNFLQLREELLREGREFRTRCDTEVLVEGFAAWGEGLFRRISGMFSFALHDREGDRLYLVRDRLGIKPLYYAWAGDDLVFGSEVSVLLASGLVSAELAEESIDAFLAVGYVPGPRTMFKGVQKLDPGSFLVVDGAGVRSESYWDLAAVQPLEIGYDEAKSRFETLLAESVERHLISDVPLGIFLSGGVDSSVVVAIVRRVLGRSAATFSVGFEDDPKNSELGHARRVADALETDHHEFILTPLGFLEQLDELLRHAEEPIVESAAAALMGLSQFASKHATVFLSGEGADEVLAGYPLYDTALRLERLRPWLAPLRMARGILRAGLPTEKLCKYFDWSTDRVEDWYRSIPADATEALIRRIRPGAGVSWGAPFEHHFAAVAGRSTLARMQYVDIKTWLPDDLLVKADKMTMSASIELRVPFLDPEVVEFGWSLPSSVKIHGGVRKALLKEIASQYVPRDLMYRPKQGFPTPISKWLREDLYEPCRDILLQGDWLERVGVDRRYVDRALQRHRSGREDLGRRLFSLLVLVRWQQLYLDPR